MVASLIIPIIPILFIVLIVFLIAGIKGESKEGGGEKVIKSIYIYLVLFATLMMTIGGSVGAFMAIADMVAPTPYYQTFEDYRERVVHQKTYNQDNNSLQEQLLSEEELRIRYEAMVIQHHDRQVNRAKNTVIKSLGWILVPLPVFIFFQRRLTQKEA